MTKAKLSRECRSEASSRTKSSAPGSVSRLSQESQEVIGQILQEHKKQMAEMNKQLVDAGMSVELEKRRRAEDRRRHEEE